MDGGAWIWGVELEDDAASWGRVVMGLGDMLSWEVISKSWASRLSVREVGRERVRFRVRWKARRSCFRFPVRVEAEGPERMDFALKRMVARVSLA